MLETSHNFEQEQRLLHKKHKQILSVLRSRKMKGFGMNQHSIFRTIPEVSSKLYFVEIS